jgi:hypothetical protein
MLILHPRRRPFDGKSQRGVFGLRTIKATDRELARHNQ